MGRQVWVLAYHNVEGTWAHPAPRGEGSKGFVRQLEFLKRWCHVLSLDDAVQGLESGGSLPARAVCLTFDDGYRDNLTIAAPALERLEMPATFYLTTGILSRTRPAWWERLAWTCRQATVDSVTWEGETLGLSSDAERYASNRRIASSLRTKVDATTRDRTIDELQHDLRPHGAEPTADLFLDWDGARELSRRAFSIGSHTVSHPVLPLEDAPGQERELAESKRALSDGLDLEITSLAYPNGSYDASCVDAARRTKYRHALTCDFGANDPSTPRLELRRVGVMPERGVYGLLASVGRVRTRLRSLRSPATTAGR